MCAAVPVVLFVFSVCMFSYFVLLVLFVVFDELLRSFLFVCLMSLCFVFCVF